jgi:hypothetical protein
VTSRSKILDIWHSPFFCRNVRCTFEVLGPPFCSTARRRFFIHVGRFSVLVFVASHCCIVWFCCVVFVRRAARLLLFSCLQLERPVSHATNVRLSSTDTATALTAATSSSSNQQQIIKPNLLAGQQQQHQQQQQPWNQSTRRTVKISRLVIMSVKAKE